MFWDKITEYFITKKTCKNLWWRFWIIFFKMNKQLMDVLFPLLQRRSSQLWGRSRTKRSHLCQTLPPSSVRSPRRTSPSSGRRTASQSRPCPRSTRSSSTARSTVWSSWTWMRRMMPSTLWLSRRNPARQTAMWKVRLQICCQILKIRLQK